MIFIGGGASWNENETIHSDDLAEQVRQALLHTLAILAEANAGTEHVTRMTWYVTDKQEYLSSRKEIG